jgi:hypothetical protein
MVNADYFQILVAKKANRTKNAAYSFKKGEVFLFTKGEHMAGANTKNGLTFWFYPEDLEKYFHTAAESTVLLDMLRAKQDTTNSVTITFDNGDVHYGKIVNEEEIASNMHYLIGNCQFIDSPTLGRTWIPSTAINMF